MMQPKELAIRIAQVLDSKKAQEILILEVSHLTVIADYMVIANGRSQVQVRALSEEVQEKLGEAGEEPRRKEGMQEGRWIVLDYGSVLVHIFHEDEREYYHLERLWMDGSNRVLMPEE